MSGRRRDVPILAAELPGEGMGTHVAVGRRMQRIAGVVALLLSLTAVLIGASACDDDECCPISEQLVCTNFLSGGSKSTYGGRCPGGATDNLPMNMKKKIDENGCPYWEAEPNSPRTCGVAIDSGVRRPDAGDAGDASDEEDAGDSGDASKADAPTDAAGDADADQ